MKSYEKSKEQVLELRGNGFTSKPEQEHIKQAVGGVHHFFIMTYMMMDPEDVKAIINLRKLMRH